MKNILLLEDEKIIGRIYAKYLEDAGFAVTWVTTTEQAKDASAQKKFAALLLDHGIADSSESGLDILPELRDAQPGAKIIIISNYSSSNIQQRAKKLGADAYLIKLNTPLPSLIESVQNLLAR